MDKLTSSILKIFQQNYRQYSPSYNEIKKIIDDDPPRDIKNRKSILRIINNVDEYYKSKAKQQEDAEKEEAELNAYNSSIHNTEAKDLKMDYLPSNRVLDNNINPIALPPLPKQFGFTPPSSPKELMETTTDYWEHLIVIDSKDRDFDRFTSPNNYVIDFSPGSYVASTERKGYIKRGFHNIVSVELVSCFFLDTSSDVLASDNSAPPPYVILEIPELQSNLHGTNETINNGLDMLTTYVSQGNYKYFNLPFDGGTESRVKTFEPRISLNRITIRFKLPDGTYYSFGDNDATTSTVNQIVLRIRQLRHMTTTSFLHKENS